MTRVDTAELNRLRDEAEAIATVAAAADAGLLELLGEAGGTAGEIAGRGGFDARATAIVLGALAQLGLLEEDGGRFRPTRRCRETLCRPGSEDYAAGGLPLWLRNLRAHTLLADALRDGGPVTLEDEAAVGEPEDEEGIKRFMAAMAAAPRERTERLAELCLARRPDARSVLDVGGGPGHIARAFARRGLRVTLLDTPDTVEVVAREYGLREVEGLTLAGGDFNADPLPEGPFDIVLLSNVLHIYGPGRNRELLRRVGEACSPGGVAAIADFVRGRSPRAARFAVVMLLRTEEGNTYTEEEFAAWLREAGFGDVETADLDEDRQLVTGVKGR